MEKHCTLEQAKRLKELGITAQSESVWVDTFPMVAIKPMIKRRIDLEKFLREDSILSDEAQNAFCKNSLYSAFDVAELGAIIPEEIVHNKNFEDGSYYRLCGFADTEQGRVHLMWFENNDLDEPIPVLSGQGKTEAEARADLLIRGIENKLPGFSIEEINERIK